MNNLKLFAVTDQFVIIPLVVVETQTREDYTKVITEITKEHIDDLGRHAECHHKTYFKEMWLEEDGTINKQNVYSDLEHAKEYALKRLEEQLSYKCKEISRLVIQKEKIQNT